MLVFDILFLGAMTINNKNYYYLNKFISSKESQNMDKFRFIVLRSNK